MSVRDLWLNIEELGAPGFIARRISPESRHTLHAAVDMMHGSRLLILECPGNPSEAVLSALSSTDGYTAKCAPLDISTTPKLCIILESTPETPFKVFESLCDDVAEAVLQRGPDENAEDIFAGRLMLWKQLFETRRAGGLPYHERLGLIAEILHMSDLLTAGGNPSDVVSWWTGPDKLSTDFQSPKGRTEVKATTSRKQYKVRIHGERQLEPVDDRPLHLVAMIFEKVVGDGMTLPGLISTMKELFGKGAAGQIFSAKLLQAGYLSVHEDSYQQDGLRLMEKREYLVAEGFPRIAASAVPEGAGDLEYSLDLSACEPFRRAEGSAVRILLGKEG